MNSNGYPVSENLICIGNGYKPRDFHKWGPGVRDIYALHYVIAGRGYFQANNVTYTLKAGESFIIFPQTKVYYYPDKNDPWEYTWIDFKGKEVLNLLANTRFATYMPVAPAFSQNLQQLFYDVGKIGVMVFEKERANAKLHLLLSYYMEYYPRIDSASKIDYVLLVKEYIENNYWKVNLTVSSIGEFVNIDRTYLFRLFKEATGMSILNYLTVYRIKRACELLKSSGLSIKSVACSVGYQDQMYFSKVFKKMTAYSPSEYAKIKSNKAD